jgi:ion channel-forming bestrophin family protein
MKSIYQILKEISFISTEIRNTTRIIWIGVRDDGDRQEKEMIIKLLLAFAVAVKHHLRSEFGTEWYDLKDHLPDILRDEHDKEKGSELDTIISRSEDNANMCLPLVIIFHIGLYIDKKRNVMDGDISDNLNSLVSIFGNLDNACNTPLPFAPNVHL